MGRGSTRPCRRLCSGPGSAPVAPTEERDLVSFERESRRHAHIEVAGTSVHLEHAVARFAQKVMMVILARDLVPRWLAGDLNRSNGAAGDERIDRSIDRRKAQAGDRVAGERQHLGSAQRALRVFDRLKDGASLACRPHGR
jgi:hypothetical protein